MQSSIKYDKEDKTRCEKANMTAFTSEEQGLELLLPPIFSPHDHRLHRSAPLATLGITSSAWVAVLMILKVH